MVPSFLGCSHGLPKWKTWKSVPPDVYPPSFVLQIHLLGFIFIYQVFMIGGCLRIFIRSLFLSNRLSGLTAICLSCESVSPSIF